MAAYSSRHYAHIADNLKALKPMCEKGYPGGEAYLQWRYTVERFARMFKEDNPRFKEVDFLQACGHP